MHLPLVERFAIEQALKQLKLDAAYRGFSGHSFYIREPG